MQITGAEGVSRCWEMSAGADVPNRGARCDSALSTAVEVTGKVGQIGKEKAAARAFCSLLGNGAEQIKDCKLEMKGEQ